MQSNLTVCFKANATKATATKAVAIKRTYAEKMLRKYEHLVNKRYRDKQLQLGRNRKDWMLEI
jgi:hypothetical protein